MLGSNPYFSLWIRNFCNDFSSVGLDGYSHIDGHYMVSCLNTVLAVERISEEDVQSGVYNFPAQRSINGNCLPTGTIATAQVDFVAGKNAA